MGSQQIPAYCDAHRFDLRIQARSRHRSDGLHLKQSLRGHGDFPRYYPHTQRVWEGFTDMSRFVQEQIALLRGKYVLPDKEFRSMSYSTEVERVLPPLHVAMQTGPYLHPHLWMSGVWPLRILV